jgi:hypothetical protein
MKNDSDEKLERQFETLEHAIPEATTPARPEKDMAPAWLIADWKAARPDLDWTTQEAQRASMNTMFRDQKTRQEKELQDTKLKP